jgi:urea transport system ATP-binding protein
MTMTASDDQELLAIRGLNVYYGESHILRNVDLTVRPGQVACLVGLNGVGKTPLKTIIGLLRQRSGSIYLDGSDLGAQPPPRAGAGGCRLRAPGPGDHPPADGARKPAAWP